jgi:hypothetical protein
MTISPPNYEDERLLLLKEAAKIARVSVVTLRRWIAAGLPSLGSGRVLVRPSDLMAHLEAAQKRTRASLATLQALHASLEGQSIAPTTAAPTAAQSEEDVHDQ